MRGIFKRFIAFFLILFLFLSSAVLFPTAVSSDVTPIAIVRYNGSSVIDSYANISAHQVGNRLVHGNNNSAMLNAVGRGIDITVNTLGSSYDQNYNFLYFNNSFAVESGTSYCVAILYQTDNMVANYISGNGYYLTNLTNGVATASRPNFTTQNVTIGNENYHLAVSTLPANALTSNTNIFGLRFNATSTAHPYTVYAAGAFKSAEDAAEYFENIYTAVTPVACVHYRSDSALHSYSNISQNAAGGLVYGNNNSAAPNTNGNAIDITVNTIGSGYSQNYNLLYFDNKFSVAIGTSYCLAILYQTDNAVANQIVGNGYYLTNLSNGVATAVRPNFTTKSITIGHDNYYLAVSTLAEDALTPGTNIYGLRFNTTSTEYPYTVYAAGAFKNEDDALSYFSCDHMNPVFPLGTTFRVGRRSNQRFFCSWTAATDMVCPETGITYDLYASDSVITSSNLSSAIRIASVTGKTSVITKNLFAETDYYFAVTATDAAGNSGFWATSSTACTPTSVYYATDLVNCRKALFGISQFADINGDGVLDIRDLVYLKRKIVFQINNSDDLCTDLSEENAPVYENSNSTTFTTQSSGAGMTDQFVLAFDGNEVNYNLSSFGMSEYHDCYNCTNCGYIEKNGSTVFCIGNNDSGISGVEVIFKSPVDVSVFSGMKMTYMTSKEIVNSSQIRILKNNAVNVFDTLKIDNYPDFSGATADWKTVDFNLTTDHIKSLSDDDGCIRGFKLYFRNKDNTDIYIKDITFDVSIESLCNILAISDNCFYSYDAMKEIAARIADNLTNSGIGVNIELKCLNYVQNTSSSHGSITYNVMISDQNGREQTFSDKTTAIKKIEGVWLELSDSGYGVMHDSNDQWKDSFNAGAILTLENDKMMADEGIAAVEYAVIARDIDLINSDVIWYTPHLLEMNDKGISSLYINAVLDYGNTLIDGQSYRFVVRGVTNNENYILYLDIPFIYQPFSQAVLNSLENALAIAEAAKLECSVSQIEKANFIKEQLTSLINNEDIRISVSACEEGMLSGRYEARLSYVGNDGHDLFAYEGVFFRSTKEITYRQQGSDIILTSPRDGETGIRIASDETVRLWNTDSDILISDIYQFKSGEVCDPQPVRLEWSDTEEGKMYRVSVAESPDLTDAWNFDVEGNALDVYSLKSGTRYFWRVERDGCTSETLTFVTEKGYPRYILADKVSNFRDLGGYVTVDGKTVKQGLAFRLSNLDSVNSSDIDFITNYLGVRTELDLRGVIQTSKLGNDINAYSIGIKSYNGIIEEEWKEPWRQAIAVFAKEENYPIAYHCAVGRDRTGTMTVLILGLIGVDEDTILKDYIISKNSVSGGKDGVSSARLYQSYKHLIGLLKRFGNENATFSESVEAYMLSIGVTSEEIASIREIWLDD